MVDSSLYGGRNARHVRARVDHRAFLKVVVLGFLFGILAAFMIGQASAAETCMHRIAAESPLVFHPEDVLRQGPIAPFRRIGALEKCQRCVESLKKIGSSKQDRVFEF